jgi:hypothetical protein
MNMMVDDITLAKRCTHASVRRMDLQIVLQGVVSEIEVASKIWWGSDRKRSGGFAVATDNLINARLLGSITTSQFIPVL